MLRHHTSDLRLGLELRVFGNYEGLGFTILGNQMEKQLGNIIDTGVTLEAQLLIYWGSCPWFPIKFMLSITQEPTIWVPGLLGLCRELMATSSRVDLGYCTFP